MDRVVGVAPAVWRRAIGLGVTRSVDGPAGDLVATGAEPAPRVPARASERTPRWTETSPKPRVMVDAHEHLCEAPRASPRRPANPYVVRGRPYLTVERRGDERVDR